VISKSVMSKWSRLLADVTWLYPRPVTTAAVAVTSTLGTLLVRALLPRRLRDGDLRSLAAASTGAYVVLRLGAHTGWSKRFKHSVLDWFGGDVDDAQTWLLAALSGGGILVALRALRSAVSRIIGSR
jgi:hypothetical protein